MAPNENYVPHYNYPNTWVNGEFPTVYVSLDWLVERIGGIVVARTRSAPMDYNRNLWRIAGNSWRIWYTDEGEGWCRVDTVRQVNIGGILDNAAECRQVFLEWLEDYPDGVVYSLPWPTIHLEQDVLQTSDTPARTFSSEPIILPCEDRPARTCPYTVNIVNESRVMFWQEYALAAEVDIIEGREHAQTVYSVVRYDVDALPTNMMLIAWAWTALHRAGINIRC